ncbi:MAG: GntR family transcriptional regulator [Odoribacteraceae bacterium]|jgi:predicted RNA-binding protein (virulence factor B family)|nr:GntR family transcriptional regulator [Odoribacteraceae bacterium]
MIRIGEYNKLEVLRIVEIGIYLDGGEYWGDILLPNASAAAGAKENAREGDLLEVFIYFDSEDRIIATMERPLAIVGEFALMKVVGVSSVGAFLEWGLRKDLLVPFREQREEMVVGREYLVYLYVDNTTDRIVASSKWYKFLDRRPPAYRPGDEVQLIVAQLTELGYKVIVNNSHEALVYHNEVFQPLRVGERVTGYIKNAREDGKIDCILQKNDGHYQIERLARLILDKLEQNGGRLDISDKSDPGEIYATFACSKKNYKKAVGSLFRNRLVDIREDHVQLLTGPRCDD